MERKFLGIVLIVISLFAMLSFIFSISDNMTTEEGYWSKVEYTDSLLIGYPDYYPLILRFSSLGPLPKDLQAETNYTESIKISYYNIRFNISDIKSIDRNRSSDEWIGASKPLELEFDITDEVAANYTAVEITIEFAPHNFTEFLNNDIYVLVVEFRKEGTGIDVLFAFAVTFVPFIFILLNVKLYRHINSKFIRNIRWKEVPKYYIIYLMRMIRNLFRRKNRNVTDFGTNIKNS